MREVYAEALTKTYRSKVKAAGLAASFKSLAKSEYREVRAVSGITFSVDKGERLAFIGPNGAGKSTTIKMLTGILSPTSGELGVLDMDPSKDRRRLSRRIGTVFGQKSQLWFHLPPADSFELLGAIYDVPAPELKKRTEELKERFQLGEFFNTPVRRLSLGQRIRCEVAASMLHEPEILFLDEPTIGLDVVVKQELRERILEMNREKGVTVFLTSHDTGDIEKLCRRAIVIDKGDIVLDESMNELRRKHLTGKSITVRYADELSFENPAWARSVTRTRHSMTLTFDAGEKSVDEAMRELISRGEVSDITVEDPSMESIIASIFTGGESA